MLYRYVILQDALFYVGQERTGMDMNGHKGTDSAIGSTGLLLLC